LLPPLPTLSPYTTLFRSHLLRGLKRVTRARGFALGVRADAQSRAVGPLLYAKIIDDLRVHPRIDWVEGSWILATNHPMNAALERSEEHTSELQSRENLVC